MLLFNSIGFAEIYGNYLFAIKASDFWLLVMASMLLAVASGWLARRPQPVPNWRS